MNKNLWFALLGGFIIGAIFVWAIGLILFVNIW